MRCAVSGRLLLFCADTELLHLYNSEFIICDGTFQTAPDTSYQVYTLHGYVHGEALALAWALLPNKSQQSYTDMFGALADAFIRTFRDVGRRTFLTDFESAGSETVTVHLRGSEQRPMECQGQIWHGHRPDIC